MSQKWCSESSQTYETVIRKALSVCFQYIARRWRDPDSQLGSGCSNQIWSSRCRASSSCLTIFCVSNTSSSSDSDHSLADFHCLSLNLPTSSHSSYFSYFFLPPYEYERLRVFRQDWRHPQNELWLLSMRCHFLQDMRTSNHQARK